MPELKKLAEYLYEMTCDDIDLEAGRRYLAEHVMGVLGACTAVRSYSIVGRNFDYLYGDECEFVVHTPAGPGRFASIGVAGGLPQWNTALVEGPGFDEVAPIVPLVMLDGVNEKGVFVECNVVPCCDLDVPTSGTNPGAEDLPQIFVVRYVLDHASSAHDAVMRLKRMNVCGDVSFARGLAGKELHFMIADPQETYVVEFINNRIRVLCDETVLTNYYLNLGPTQHMNGVERFNEIKRHYAMAGTYLGMELLLRRVLMSKCCDNSLDEPRLSDHFGEELGGVEYNLANASDPEMLGRLYDANEANAANFERGDGQWITVHSSIYDIEKRTLKLFTQEDYERSWEFSL